MLCTFCRYWYNQLMISYISGKIIHKNDKSIIILSGNIGYTVYTLSNILSELALEEEACLWTYMAVRENSMELFGFKEKNELDFFELLISISGIGPRGALGIMAVTTVNTLSKAISTGDTSYLTKVSGIGKKTAEKIVLELRDKLGAQDDDSSYSLRDESDALLALQSLGYAQREARDALKEIPSDITDTAEKVKTALKILGSK